MDMQFLLVGLSNTVHLFATVLWIGWSLLLPLAIAPRAFQAHGADDHWSAQLVRRATPIAYGALAALGATGMLQMSANPQYEGMFTIANLWSALLLAKHLFVLASVGAILYLASIVSPRLRIEVRREALGRESRAAPLAGQFRLVAWLNALFGLAVLALTGWMTAIP